MIKNKNDYSVRFQIYLGYVIQYTGGTYTTYLWRDGQDHHASPWTNCPHEEGVWKTSAEAQKFLDEHCAVEPRTGDMVRFSGKELRLILWNPNSKKFYGYDDTGMVRCGCFGSVENHYRDGTYEVIGNVFDDYNKSK